MTSSTLVSTAALAEHLDGSWIVVDCRYDLANTAAGREEFDATHIPGASYLSLSHDLSSTPTGQNGRHPLPSEAAMAALFGRLGIEPGVQVVAYDQETGMFASRFWWMLRYMGHDAVAVLDGGWSAWCAEQRPVWPRDGGVPESATRPATTFAAHPRAGMVLGVGEVERLRQDPGTLLVDARAADRFEGAIEPIDRVPGHIPGAVNHHYRSNLTQDGRMLPEQALRTHYAALLQGHTPAQTVAYCGSGVSACVNLLAMEHIGLHGARLYPGSWSEWSADPARAVERGAGPRAASTGGGLSL